MLTCHKHYKNALFCGLSPPLDKSGTAVTVCDTLRLSLVHRNPNEHTIFIALPKNARF
jgi:hypothetical protein